MKRTSMGTIVAGLLIVGFIAFRILSRGGFLSGGPSYGKGYQNYQDPKGTFSVDLPEKYPVKVIQRPIQLSDGTTVADIHGAEGGDKIKLFAVSVIADVDLETAIQQSSRRELMDMIVQDSFTGIQGTMERSEDIERREHTVTRAIGRGRIGKKTMGWIIVEIYLIEEQERIFKVIIVGEKKTIENDSRGKRFFQSFRILE